MASKKDLERANKRIGKYIGSNAQKRTEKARQLWKERRKKKFLKEFESKSYDEMVGFLFEVHERLQDIEDQVEQLKNMTSMI